MLLNTIIFGQDLLRCEVFVDLGHCGPIWMIEPLIGMLLQDLVPLVLESDTINSSSSNSLICA